MISEKEELRIEGRREHLEDLLERKYGMTKAEAGQEIAEWEAKPHQAL